MEEREAGGGQFAQTAFTQKRKMASVHLKIATVETPGTHTVDFKSQSHLAPLVE